MKIEEARLHRAKLSAAVPFSESFEDSTEKTHSNMPKSITALPKLEVPGSNPGSIDGEQFK